jgi:hypothetical protein
MTTDRLTGFVSFPEAFVNTKSFLSRHLYSEFLTCNTVACWVECFPLIQAASWPKPYLQFCLAFVKENAVLSFEKQLDTDLWHLINELENILFGAYRKPISTSTVFRDEKAIYTKRHRPIRFT